MKRFSMLLLPFLVAAHAASAQTTPLVVIRFNQPHVYYDQQLYNAMSQAVAIKPDLTVEVLSLSPQTPDSSTNEDWQETASAHTRQVVALLQQIGMPMNRIRVTGQRQPGLKYDETHVFVR